MNIWNLSLEPRQTHTNGPNTTEADEQRNDVKSEMCRHPAPLAASACSR